MRMNKVYFSRFVREGVVAVLLLMTLTLSAQVLRTSYFMEGAQYKLQMNPALAPDRGFVDLPVIGMTNGRVWSDALNVGDISDLIRHCDKDDYYTTDSFFGKLKETNKADATLGTELIAAGWWHGKGFISFNVGAKAEGNIRVPRELVSFMRDMKGLNTNDYSDFYRDLSNEELNINAYTEIGVGYTRLIKDRLSIGGRVKLLLGQGNLRLKVKEASVRTNLIGVDPNLDWSNATFMDVINAQGTASIEATAELESSFEGLDLITNDRGYIEQVKFNSGNIGVAGYGAAFDLGVAYRVTEDWTLSAAVTDLGFIRWSKGCTQVAHAVTDDLTYDSQDPGDVSRFAGIVGHGEAINLHLLRLTPESQQSTSRKTSLNSTMALGCEYTLVHDKLRLGTLFTNRFTPLCNGSELTLSLNYHPRSMLEFSLSYSPILCGGRSVGAAMKLGPFFIGTDYLSFTGKSKSWNGLLGLSIPLGGRAE